MIFIIIPRPYKLKHDFFPSIIFLLLFLFFFGLISSEIFTFKWNICLILVYSTLCGGAAASAMAQYDIGLVTRAKISPISHKAQPSVIWKWYFATVPCGIALDASPLQSVLQNLYHDAISNRKLVCSRKNLEEKSVFRCGRNTNKSWLTRIFGSRLSFISSKRH